MLPPTQLPIADFVWFQNVVLPLLGMGMGAFALFGLYRTINRFADRRHERQMAAARQSPDSELEELRHRVELLEESVDRVQDLEERLEFAERLLTRERRQQIEPGSGD